MSTATTTTVVSERSLLRQLTMIQAGRYARHPLFWIPVLFLLVPTLAATADDAPASYFTLSDNVVVAFLVGVLGLIVAYRLTRTEDRALALLPSAPVAASTRTLALLGACLVPAAVGAVALLVRLVTWAAYPPPPELVELAGGWAPVLTMQLSGFVVACFGGPALGVAVGRWLRFPGAGLVVAVALTVTEAFMVGGAIQIDGIGGTWLGRITGAAMPWQDWIAVDTVNGEDVLNGLRPGSMTGALVYAISLSGLAAWAAVMKDAEGAVRTRWTRLGWLFGVAAVLSYLWTLLG